MVPLKYNVGSSQNIRVVAFCCYSVTWWSLFVVVCFYTVQFFCGGGHRYVCVYVCRMVLRAVLVFQFRMSVLCTPPVSPPDRKLAQVRLLNNLDCNCYTMVILLEEGRGWGEEGGGHGSYE